MAYKNQHYIPRVYLRNFQIDPSVGKLAVYNKKNNKIYYRPTRKIFSKKDCFTLNGVEEALRFYDKKLDKYNDRYCLERELHLMESEVGRILKDLREEDCLDYINQDKIESIVDWGAWIFVTTKLIDHEDILKLPNNERIGVYIDQYNKILPIFKNKTWKLGLVAKEDTLFSSDRPISLSDIKLLNNHTNLDKGAIFFPLSPKRLLLGSPNNNLQFPSGKKPFILPEEITLLANWLTYSQSDNLIIANNKGSIEKFLSYNVLAKRGA